MLTITKITKGIFKNIKKQLETTPKHVHKKWCDSVTQLEIVSKSYNNDFKLIHKTVITTLKNTHTFKIINFKKKSLDKIFMYLLTE